MSAHKIPTIMTFNWLSDLKIHLTNRTSIPEIATPSFALIVRYIMELEDQKKWSLKEDFSKSHTSC